MLIDHIGMATCFDCFQNGLLYILLPMLGAFAFWHQRHVGGFCRGPDADARLCLSVRVPALWQGRTSRSSSKDMDSEIEVMDDTLTPETAAALSERVGSCPARAHIRKEAPIARRCSWRRSACPSSKSTRRRKKPILIELSLFFDPDSVLIIQRDSGKLFDLTDPDAQIKGLSGFILSGMMKAHKEKAYLVTTGYNRNIIRFPGERKET